MSKDLLGHDPNEITTATKIAELERELGMRHHVYPKRVAAGTMRQNVAARQIAVLEAILADYRKAAG